MHNKTFTVDGRIVITGGRNIADEYFDYNQEYNFRDRDVLLLGGVTGEIQASFNTFWNDPLSRPVGELVQNPGIEASSRARIEELHQFACNPVNYWPEVRAKLDSIPLAFERIKSTGELRWLDNVQFISDVPGKNDGSQGLGGGGVTLEALENLVRGAKRSIAIQSPYLVTTEEGRALFQEAVARGVEIRILTNSLGATDNLQAFSGYQRDRTALLKTGVRVFEFRPDAAERRILMKGVLPSNLKHPPIFGLHAKSMVIDGEIAVIGTFNLDPRSANLNTECITVIHSREVAQGVLTGMEREFQPENSWETTLASNPDARAGKAKRFKVWLLWILPKGIL